MRKDFLKKLILNYSNAQATALNKILEKHFSNLKDHHDIAFNEVITLLIKEELNFTYSYEIQENKSNHSDSELFFHFITGAASKETSRNSIFHKLPDSISESKLSLFCDVKSITNLSVCSSSLYPKMTGSIFWRAKFDKMNLNPVTFEKLFKLIPVKNYQNIFRNLSRGCFKEPNRIMAWELYCLSGDRDAIAKSVELGDLTRNTVGLLGNALHYTAVSGSVDAMRYLFEALNNPAGNVNIEGNNALILTAYSRSVAAMKYAFENLNNPANSLNKNGFNALLVTAMRGYVPAIKYAFEILKLPASSVDKDGNNALHHAAASNCVAAVKYVLKNLKLSVESVNKNDFNALLCAASNNATETMEYLYRVLNISPNCKSNKGFNALLIAARRGHVKAMEFSVKILKNPITSITKNNYNALHLAVFSCSVKAIQYTLEELKISPISTCNDGNNILHIAAQKGSVESVILIRKFCHRHNIKLEPSEKNKEGHDAFKVAEKSKNYDAMKRILNMTINDLLDYEPVVTNSAPSLGLKR